MFMYSYCYVTLTCLILFEVFHNPGFK